MPLFYFVCTNCGSPDKRILEPVQVSRIKCRSCGGTVKRTPKPPTTHLKEVVDTGMMAKRLENFVDGQSLTKARSKLDLSKPDWMKK